MSNQTTKDRLTEIRERDAEPCNPYVHQTPEVLEEPLDGLSRFIQALRDVRWLLAELDRRTAELTAVTAKRDELELLTQELGIWNGELVAALAAREPKS